MSSQTPAYGPTTTIPASDETPLAAVRLALAVTREQLRAALATGHAENVGTPALADMSAADIRSEVEGHLAAGAILELHHTTDTIGPRIDAEHRADLDAAIDRAYTPPPAPAVQDPHYRDGTVTLQTTDHGEVTIPEPGWCTGHDGDLVGRLSDLSHDGTPTQVFLHGDTPIMQAHISHAPYLQASPEPHPVLSVHLDYNGDLSPAEARALSRALRAASARLDRALAEVAHLRGENR